MKACIADFGIAILQEHSSVPATTVTNNSFPRTALVLELQCRAALRMGNLPQSLATTMSSRMSSFSGKGTYRWMPPERLQPEVFDGPSAKATFEGDVFAFAMLIVEVRRFIPDSTNAVVQPFHRSTVETCHLEVHVTIPLLSSKS